MERLRAWWGRMRKRNPSFFVYLAAKILASLSGLIVVRFLIELLDKPQYGAWGYLKAVSAVAVPVVSLSLPAAMMRMFFDRKKDDHAGQASLITTVFWLSVASCLLLLGGASAMWAWDRDTLAFAFFGAVATGTVLSQYFNYLTRMRNDYVLHFINRAAETAGFMGMVALAAWWVGLGDTPGWLTGDRLLLVAGLNAACVWGSNLLGVVIYARRRVIRGFGGLLGWGEIRGLARFSTPLSVTALIGWTLSSSDIYLLKELSTLTEVADYVFAAGIASFVTLITQSALTDWPTFYYGEMREDHPERDVRIARRVQRFLVAHIGAMAVIRLIAVFAYDLLGAERYLNGVEFIDYLVLGNFFFLAGNLLSAGIGYAKKTWLTTVTFAVPGALNVGLNLWLIPLWGARAAALTTLLAYAVMAGLSLVLGRRYYAFREVPRMLLLAVLATAVALAPLGWLRALLGYG